MKRQSHEKLALERFRERAESRSHEIFHSQRSKNRIPISGNVYYQFGDLRVEFPTLTIIVEVESSGGGTTNLVKYWESHLSNRLVKPIKLIHLFRQTSANDYEAHMIVWRFLSERMHRELPAPFEAQLFKYDLRTPSTLAPAIELFDHWLVGAGDPRVAV